MKSIFFPINSSLANPKIEQLQKYNEQYIEQIREYIKNELEPKEIDYYTTTYFQVKFNRWRDKKIETEINKTFKDPELQQYTKEERKELTKKIKALYNLELDLDLDNETIKDIINWIIEQNITLLEIQNGKRKHEFSGWRINKYAKEARELMGDITDTDSDI